MTSKQDISIELPKEGLKDSSSIQNPRNDDASSIDSFSTLMSEDSGDTCDESSCEHEEQDEMKRLQAKFKERDRLLRRITKNKSPEYARMLKESEEMVRAEAFRLLKLKQNRRKKESVRGGHKFEEEEEEKEETETENPVVPKTSAEKTPDGNSTETISQDATDAATPMRPTSNDVASEPKYTTVKGDSLENTAPQIPDPTGTSSKQQEPDCSPTPIRQFSFLEKIRRTLVMELTHGIKAYTTMLLFCAAHMALYECISTAVSELTKNVGSYLLVNACTLLLGLFLTRISGYLWWYVDKNTYRCVKFDMHNRIRHGHWDARILRWFRKRPSLQITVGLVGLYLCFIPVVYYQSQMLSILDIRQQLPERLPSSKFGVVTPFSQFLSGVTSAAATETQTSTCGDANECTSEELLADLTAQDEMYLYSKLSVESYESIMGLPNSAVVSGLSTFLYYLVLIIIYVRLLKTLNYSFTGMS
jgi:hypothetical protein